MAALGACASICPLSVCTEMGSLGQNIHKRSSSQLWLLAQGFPLAKIEFRVGFGELRVDFLIPASFGTRFDQSARVLPTERNLTVTYILLKRIQGPLATKALSQSPNLLGNLYYEGYKISLSSKDMNKICCFFCIGFAYTDS